MVVGGDGSVNEVVNGSAGAEGVELAVIARGTGWDFVRTYGIPRELEQAVEVALSGDIREIDLGLVTFRTWAGDEGRSHFANVASAGISGAIAQRANETSKALGGKISYYWSTLAVFVRWQTGEMRITVDDETRAQKVIDVLVANGRYLGGGMMMLPEAEPDDGLFDVLVIGDVTKRDLVVHAAEKLPGQASPAPAARGAARPHGHRGRGRAASDPARRRAAGHDARALRGRPACAPAPCAALAEDSTYDPEELGPVRQPSRPHTVPMIPISTRLTPPRGTFALAR